MIPICLDIETEPRPDVKELLPPELMSDEVPGYIMNPEKPDWSADVPSYGKPKTEGKCPQFGGEKKVPAIPQKLMDMEEGEERDKAIEDFKTLKINPALRHNTERQERIAEWKAKKMREIEEDASERKRKQDEWLENKEAAWERRRQKGIDEWKEKLEQQRQDFVDRAALDARISHVRMIGWRTLKEGEPFYVYAIFDEGGDSGKFGAQGSNVELVVFTEEAAMLEWFFSLVFQWIRAEWKTDFEQHRIMTYYGHTFDFPYLIRRAWMNGIEAHPTYFIQDFEIGRHRFFRESFIDLDEAYKMGDRGMKTGGLGELARLMGCGEKTDDGARFWEIYAEDPAEALAYLRNDLDMTWGVAEVMQLTEESAVEV